MKTNLAARFGLIAAAAVSAAVVTILAAVATASAATAVPSAAQCKGTIYLTFDTGSQSQADLIARILNKHHIKATFFLANEKTVREDYSLDPSWAPFWKARVAEGHAFGTHTFDHVYVQRDLPDGSMEIKPQFGPNAGKRMRWTAQQYCEELRRVETRFHELTGASLDQFWRAPGGRLTRNLRAAGEACGYAHVGWAPAGFSGDELPSEKWSNQALLKRALNELKDGDIFMAHLGVWSRKDSWAPGVLDPLITGLKQKGFCFATLREHPDFRKP
jgi:peptidoglycan/xylan/chitin deacetylase (PgdA/CDA1 family)